MRAIPTATLSLIGLVVFGQAWPLPADAGSTPTTLASFNGANGAEPFSGVVRDDRATSSARRQRRGQQPARSSRWPPAAIPSPPWPPSTAPTAPSRWPA